MFLVTAEKTFTHTITVCVPVDGGHVDQTFKATFRVVDPGQLTGGDTSEGQMEDLRKVIVTLDDLVDDNREKLPYSDALRDQLLVVPYVRIALINAYIRGITKAKLGN